jgi:hypothetical protein
VPTSLKSKTLTRYVTSGLAWSSKPAGGGGGGPFDGVAELPRATVDTTYSAPTGNTWTATNTSDNNAAGTGSGNRTNCGLQYALNNCARGDTILVQSGSTFNGSFTFPTKTGTGWIYVMTTALPGVGLPVVGVRAIATDASSMPTLTADNFSTGIGLSFPAQSSYWRLVGLRVIPRGSNWCQALICIGPQNSTETVAANLPSYITIDRCILDGNGSNQCLRGVQAHGDHIALVDSRVDNIVWTDAGGTTGRDAQAYVAWCGRGPHLIRNNFLEAIGETTMFGGGDTGSEATGIPSDITITGNHYFRDLAYIGRPSCKALAEFKKCRRALCENNVFENLWDAAPPSFVFPVTVRNQDGGDTFAVCEDITLRYNRCVNVCKFIQTLGTDNIHASGRTKRISCHDNLVLLGNPSGGGQQFVAQFSGGDDVTVFHNSFLWTSTASWGCQMASSSEQMTGFVFRDNILPAAAYQLGSTYPSGSFTFGAAGLTAGAPSADFRKNVLPGASAGTHPANNFYPATFDTANFVNYAGGNYRLAAGSAYKGAATDGADVGANIELVPA